MGLEFEWDPDKAAANETKHGVTFSEASTVFADPLSITLDDPDHSGAEDRLVLLGTSTAGRLLIVAFTERRNALRIISARAMTPRERRVYEDANRF